jgi:DNA-binding NarL/FixJ family response regulator
MLRSHVDRAYTHLVARHAPADLPADAFRLQLTDLSAHLDNGERDQRSSAHHMLTPRERDVLRLLVQGKTNQEIATALGTKWRTVSKQLEGIFRKLRVETRTAAAMRAMDLGLHG